MMDLEGCFHGQFKQEVSTECGKGRSHDAIRETPLKEHNNKAKSEIKFCFRGLLQTPSRKEVD